MQNGKKNLSMRELVALNLVRLRRDLGISQDDLAAKAELHRTLVAKVERQHRNITIDNLEKLAQGLNVHPAELFRDPLEEVR